MGIDPAVDNSNCNAGAVITGLSARGAFVVGLAYSIAALIGRSGEMYSTLGSLTSASIWLCVRVITTLSTSSNVRVSIPPNNGSLPRRVLGVPFL